MSDEKIETLRRLLAEATPPYMVNSRGNADGPPFEVWHTQGLGGPVARFDDVDEAEAFVAAVNALPGLLDDVERLTRERDEAHRLSILDGKESAK